MYQTFNQGYYWQHQVRVEKVLPPTALVNHPVCVSGRRACPPEEVGGPSGYDQRTLDQFSWSYEAVDRLLTNLWLPAAQELFGFSPVSFADLGWCTIAVLLGAGGLEVYKLTKRRPVESRL